MLLPASPNPTMNVMFSSAKRSLFGPIDHEETARLLEKELMAQYQQDMKKWNFNFIDGVPLEGRFVWTPVAVPVTAATNARLVRVPRITRASQQQPQHRVHRSRLIDLPGAEPAAVAPAPAVALALRSQAGYNEPLPPLTRPDSPKRARHTPMPLAPCNHAKKAKLMMSEDEQPLRLAQPVETSQQSEPAQKQQQQPSLETKESSALSPAEVSTLSSSPVSSFALSSSLTVLNQNEHQRKITAYMKIQKSTATLPSKQQ